MIHVDHKKCDLCGTCVAVCPCDALFLGNRLEPDQHRCSSCGRCANICPVGAIRVSGMRDEQATDSAAGQCHG